MTDPKWLDGLEECSRDHNYWPTQGDVLRLIAIARAAREVRTALLRAKHSGQIIGAAGWDAVEALDAALDREATRD